MLSNELDVTLLNPIEEFEAPTSVQELRGLHRLAKFHATRYDRAHPHSRDAARLWDAVWKLPTDVNSLAYAEPHLRYLVTFMTEGTHAGDPDDRARAHALAVEALEAQARQVRMNAAFAEERELVTAATASR